jgi:hypothetical protein
MDSRTFGKRDLTLCEAKLQFNTVSRPSHSTYILQAHAPCKCIHLARKHPPPNQYMSHLLPKVHTLNSTSPEVAPYDNTRVRPSTVGNAPTQICRPTFLLHVQGSVSSQTHPLRPTSRYALLHQYLIVLSQLYQDVQCAARRLFRIEPQK